MAKKTLTHIPRTVCVTLLSHAHVSVSASNFKSTPSPFLILIGGMECVGGGSIGKGLAAAEEAVVAPSTMDAAFEEQLKDGAEAFEFQAEVRYLYDRVRCGRQRERKRESTLFGAAMMA